MPEAVRGFLSMRYEKDTGPVSGFLAENLFPNFLPRPDFIAYRYSDRKNVSLRACRKLYGVQEVSWTLTEPDQLKEVKREGGLGIFQYFDPRESQSKLS